MTTQAPHPSSEQLAVCAHDVRGALTVIAGYVAMLRRGDLSADEQLLALAGIEKAVFRADALLGDALSGRPQTAHGFEAVNVGDLAAQAVADARAAFGREVALDSVPGLVVTGDPIALARTLENVLSNAAKYAPHGPIDVRVAQQGRSVVMDVADCGPGVPEDEREHVLEPFARLDRDVDSPGTGLGLTVVHSVMERMGGSVRILERDGGGAIVRMEMPLP